MWFLLTGQSSLPTSFASFVNGLSPFAGFAYNTEGLPYFSVGMGNSGVQIAKSTGQLGGAAASAASAAPKGLAGLGGMLGGGAHAAPAVAAGLGNAGSVGRLSVPAMWSGAAPALSHASAVPVSAISAVPEAAGSGNLLGGMPLAGMGGQGEQPVDLHVHAPVHQAVFAEDGPQRLHLRGVAPVERRKGGEGGMRHGGVRATRGSAGDYTCAASTRL